MTLIDKALIDLASSNSPNISATARTYSIALLTLSRRWNNRTTLKAEAQSNRRLLNN